MIPNIRELTRHDLNLSSGTKVFVGTVDINILKIPGGELDWVRNERRFLTVCSAGATQW